jgi:hypothetical protein
MKTILQLSVPAAVALLATTFLPVLAQPTLTADNFPQQLLGQEVTINQYEASNPGSLSEIVKMTGEDVTWDLSGAEFDEALTSSFMFLEPPYDDLTGGSMFMMVDPAPNYAWVTEDIVDPEQFPEPVEVAFYQNINEERALNLGFAAEVDADEDGSPDLVLIGYDPPKIEMRFPTTYGDTLTNNVEQVFQAVGVGTFRTDLSEEVEAVGWGTLVTPMGSVQALQIERKTTTTSFGFSTTFTNLEFSAPFQEAAGKQALISIQGSASLGAGGEVMSVSYSTIELDGGGGGDPTAAEDVGEIPAGFEIHQNFPNPFNPSTVIEYSLDQSGQVLMTVHDVLGREVGVLVDGVVSAGRHTVRWEALDMPSGLYQVRMQMDGQVRTRSMALAK